MKATSKEQAWEMANKIFPTDYEKDYASSERAGYDIYRHRELNYYSRICDLGDRLEVLTGEWGEDVTNIWITPPEPMDVEHIARHLETVLADKEKSYKVLADANVTDWELTGELKMLHSIIDYVKYHTTLDTTDYS
jgi:hypothetical protein